MAPVRYRIPNGQEFTSYAKAFEETLINSAEDMLSMGFISARESLSTRHGILIEPGLIDTSLMRGTNKIHTSIDYQLFNSTAPVMEAVLTRSSLRHPWFITFIICLAYFIVFLIGAVGNVLVILVVLRMPRMKTVTNFFIANLAMADLLVIIFCIAPTVFANIYIPWILGEAMCKIVPYVQGVSVTASVCSLCAVSIDRFLAIWWPLRCQITPGRCRIILVFIWIYALILPLPWAFYFKLKDLPEDYGKGASFCVEDWPDKSYGNYYFMIVNVILGCLGPLILVSMCYVLIWIKVLKRNIPTDSRDAHTDRIQHRSKMKVIKMLVLVIITFAISWIPLYALFARIRLSDEISEWEAFMMPVVAPLSQFLGLANSSINPVLYAFCNGKYRCGFATILRSRDCCTAVRYYDSVNLANSSSASVRKSSYYNNRNRSLHRQISQDRQVAYITNPIGV